MAKTILRLTEKSASVKISDAVETITLATDLKKQSETMLSTLAKTITAATWLLGIATITSPNHGFKSGDKVTVTGMTPAGYNGVGLVVIDTTINTFTYAVTVDPGVSTIFGTVSSSASVSLYRVYATGNFDITRNAQVVLKSTSGQMLDIDFSQMECVDNVNSTSDLIVTPALGVQVYLVLRKESGYTSNINPEQFGTYDNQSLATA